MNKTLINNIKAALFNAVSATTKNDVYFLIIPNKDILQNFNVVFELRSVAITANFDNREKLTEYELEIWVNNPKYELILDNVVFIKSQIYNLINVNPAIRWVNPSDQVIDYNFDYSIYSASLKFGVQYEQ